MPLMFGYNDICRCCFTHYEMVLMRIFVSSTNLLSINCLLGSYKLTNKLTSTIDYFSMDFSDSTKLRMNTRPRLKKVTKNLPKEYS